VKETTVSVGQVATAREAVLPERVQEALGELVGAAKDGLLALSVGVGLGVLGELIEEEVDEVVGPKGRHNPDRSAVRHGHEAGEVTLGGRRVAGLSSAIYNEVLQFFVIVASLVSLTVVALHNVGGWNGLQDKVKASKLGEAGLHAWQGTGVGHVTNPLGASWVSIVLGLGFVLSFGYWTTNFAEVQRALSAKSHGASRRTPLIGAFPKIFIPAVTVIPGLVALVSVKGLGGSDPNLQYNNAVPILIHDLLPTGMLGIALTGLLAAFMCSSSSMRSGISWVL
jgi:solute:Na+ symporter, SSS family